MSRSPIVHCHFMLHFYERINDDDDDGGGGGGGVEWSRAEFDRCWSNGRPTYERMEIRQQKMAGPLAFSLSGSLKVNGTDTDRSGSLTDFQFDHHHRRRRRHHVIRSLTSCARGDFSFNQCISWSYSKVQYVILMLHFYASAPIGWRH